MKMDYMKPNPILSLLFAVYFVFTGHSAFSQKVLSEQETQWVIEAKSNLEKAYSDPALPEQERLLMIARSARTLKEYGQPPEPLTGESPLRRLMENNYEAQKGEFLNLNNLINELNKGVFQRKMKLINEMQIDNISEQIKFIVPGFAPVSLTKDLVSTIFEVDISGFSGGQRTAIQEMKKKFAALAKAEKTIGNLEAIKKIEKEAAVKLDKDREEVIILEGKMKKTYEDAAAGTSTFKGYENSKLNLKNNSNNNNGQIISPLVGTWVFTAPGFYVTHRYNMDGTSSFRVNKKQNDFRYEVSGNEITYRYPDGKTKVMYFLIEGNQLFYTSKKGKKEGHPLTRQ